MIDKYRCEAGGLSRSHFMTHKGRQFRVTLSHVAVATATTVDDSIVTDATHEMHAQVRVRANQGVQALTLIEAPTGVTGGSAVVATNKNRNSAVAATTVFKTGVTGTTGGTAVRAARALVAGEVDLVGEEFIFKANTTYVLRLLTGAGAANEVDVDIEFYENLGQGDDKSNG